MHRNIVTQQIMPEQVMVVSLVVLLSATAYRTLKIGITAYKRETRALEALNAAQKLAAGFATETAPLVSKRLPNGFVTVINVPCAH
jgi:hypothetical protein